MRYLRNTLAAVSAAALVSALGAASAGASPATSTPPTVAEATIVQGLPMTSVDVYVNGTDVLQDFRFKGVVGPLPLAPGRYHIAIRLHGASPGSPPLLKRTGFLVAGENVSIVADLDQAGNPALTVFENPTRDLARGRAELVVRNVADDSGLVVYANGLRIFRELRSPDGRRIILPSQWARIRMDLPGTHTVVVGPVPVHLASQTVTIVYAIGSLSNGTLTSVQESYSSS